MIITRPWDDSTLQLTIPDDYQDLVSALNNVYLPHRLSAIVHKDLSCIEFIWTSSPIKSHLSDVIDRSYNFSYDKKTYKCTFSDSSDRLLTIAEQSTFLSQSTTGYRNLPSFRSFAYSKRHPELQRITGSFLDRPRSFWIEGIQYDDRSTIDLVETLNFYMSYYDSSSPLILIHPPKLDKTNAAPKLRYCSQSFPETIIGRDLDINLLHFWNAAQSGDPARKFLYYYRIIEYASVVYLDAQTRSLVRRTLASPHALNDINTLAEDIISTLSRYNQDDYSRMRALLKETVNPSILWKEIERNLPIHSNQISLMEAFPFHH